MHNCWEIHPMGLSVGAIPCGRPDHKFPQLRRQTLHILAKYEIYDSPWQQNDKQSVILKTTSINNFSKKIPNLRNQLA